MQVLIQMHLNKSIENIIKFFLDECFPPFLRDSKILMWLPFKIAFGKKAKFFFDFKEKVSLMSKDEITDVYIKTASVHIQQKGTDLSDKLLHEIESNILGKNVLDVGCGKGILASHLSNKHTVAACDIVINAESIKNSPEIQFKKAHCENLPFEDNEFDTVTCTHTLEHIQHLDIAIKELRRVARKRIIVVIPKERPYLYTFNLHLHFFPYRHDVINAFGDSGHAKDFIIKKIDNCWYYQETITTM
jgi:ubiquinone/menaquinone biosynthesis C-methylase UbiE